MHHSIQPNRLHQIIVQVCSLSIATILLFAGAAVAASPGPGPQVGTNLGFLNSVSGEWPFVDVFKTSTRWYRIGPCGSDCGSLELDSNGWVTHLDVDEAAQTFIFDLVPGRMPHGVGEDDTYVVLYDGVGFLQYDGAAYSVDERQTFTDAAGPHGRDLVRVDPTSDQAFAITITRTARSADPNEVVDPSEYVRNIRVIVPGFESTYSTQIFHPQFLANNDDFDVIRLMNWMDTNEGGFVRYSDYPTESSARWNQAPATIMAELANRLGADIWVNVPHFADQSFLSGFASDLAGALDPARKLYVEYSNEVWNPEMPAYQDVAVLGCSTYPDLAAGCDLDQTPGNSIPCEGHAQQPVPACDTARIRYTSQRSLESWAAFEAAFDAESAGSSVTRLVRVLGSWSGSHSLHDALLSYQDAYLQTDALAVGAYFGWPLGGDQIVQHWDPAEPADMTALFARLTTEVQDTLGDMAWDRHFLLNLGSHDYSSIPLVFYEGGQGLVARGINADDTKDMNGVSNLDRANAIFDAANRDPRMGDRYQELLDGWRLQGGVLFNHYLTCQTYNRWDRYGALEHQRQDHSSSPKYSTLMSFISSLTSPPPPVP